MEGNLLFVGGDLSGIQKFIYNISSKRAMVSLKGRSAFLKEYTNRVYKRILDIEEIKTYDKDLDEMQIYCSGGKFYMQVPDSPKIRAEIDRVKDEMEKELWKEYRGQLSINIAYLPFCYHVNCVKIGDEIGNIGILWKHITEKFNNSKKQQFKNLLVNDYDDFFEVSKVGGSVKVCEITGIEGAEDFKFSFKEQDGDKEITLCILKSVKTQIDLGIEIRNREGFKMLEEYADNTYLGVLRMDVDNLGARFIKGFASMCEYKEYSKALDNFFDVHDGNLHKIQKDFSEYLNIVYAGGDDIFAVGRWDKVISFAETVNRKFKEFCSTVLKDNTLTISGGIVVVDPKFPIAKAAEMSGDAEDAAKRYKNSSKNAFHFLGESVSWDGEFELVKSYKDEFVCLINDEGLSRGILHQLMKYAAIVKRNKIIESENKNGDLTRMPDYSYIWHVAYYLTRFMSKEKNNNKVYRFCEELSKELCGERLQTPESLRLMSIAARWAELELRELQQNNK